MNPSTGTVAAFDVDGTVTTRDCVVPFMRRVTGARRIVPRLALRTHRMVPALAARDRDRVKVLAAAAAFRGLAEVRVRTLGDEFARFVHDHWLRPDTVARLREHRDRGDRVVFVSASFEVYLTPLASLLGVDAVLGTQLAVAADGTLTGELDGANCRGPEKVRRLHAWLEANEGGRADRRIVAYGDSPGDRELLADADEAHWVGGSAA